MLCHYEITTHYSTEAFMYEFVYSQLALTEYTIQNRQQRNNRKLAGTHIPKVRLSVMNCDT